MICRRIPAEAEFSTAAAIALVPQLLKPGPHREDIGENHT